MGGQPVFVCQVWTWAEAIQVETLTQNPLSPPPRQQAARPALDCAQCESTIKTDARDHDRFPDRDVCETFEQWSHLIIHFHSSLCECSQVPAGIRSGAAEPGGWTNTYGEFQPEYEHQCSPNWAIPGGTLWSRAQMSIIKFPLAETDQLCVCVCVCVWRWSLQIENANDVLIMPLERFRKEQISAAKVRRCLCTHQSARTPAACSWHTGIWLNKTLLVVLLLLKQNAENQFS